MTTLASYICLHESQLFLQSNEVKGSYHMEEGLHRCMKFLKERNLEVDVLVTDRHKQINKWLKEAHPKIKHYYDIWHVAKGTCVSYSDIEKRIMLGSIKLTTGFHKKLDKLGKQKDYLDVKSVTRDFAWNVIDVMKGMEGVKQSKWTIGS